MVHEIKIKSVFFKAIKRGEKRFEVRKNDRGYKEGDVLRLDEIRENGTYTGGCANANVTFILEGEEWGIKDGYCVM